MRGRRKAVQLYERAIEHDPKFDFAMVNLSMLDSWIYHNFEPTKAERDLALHYADRALARRSIRPRPTSPGFIRSIMERPISRER